jgi:hypothetical protein
MRLIVIRREPHEMVASWCSLAREISGLFGSGESLAIDWSSVWETVSVRVNEASVSTTHEVVEIAFDDIVSNPVGTVESLYMSLALPFSAELRAKVADFVQRDPLRSWGRHVYDV